MRPVLQLQLLCISMWMFTSVPYADATTLETTYDGMEDGFARVFEDLTKTIIFDIKHNQSVDNLTIQLISSDLNVFLVEPDQLIMDIEASETTLFNATLTGVFIGVEILTIKIINPNGNTTEFEEVIKVLRKPTILNFVFTYLLLVLLIVSYVSMGAKLDLKVIWGNIRRPVGVSIGMFCQFIIMPLLAYCLALAVLSGTRQSAVGLLVEGSCPGGWFSNIFTLLLDCDFILSLTMTFCSTIGALAFMPLNMFIYAGTFTENDAALKTPFSEMIQQFALMLVPVLVGLFIRYKLSKLKDICLCLLKPFAWILIVIPTCLGIPSNLYIFKGSWHIWIVCLIYPFIGGSLGFMFAKVARRERSQAVTIALETGVQNSVLATTVIRLAYPQPEADLISRIPLLITLTTLFEGTSLVLIYLVHRRLYHKRYTAVKEDDQEKDSANEEDKEKDAKSDNPPNSQDINVI